MDISDDINDLFNTYNNSKNNPLIKSLIVEKTRKLITTFEISLKYFPQIYFEILKKLNHEWYNYESNSF